MTTKLMSEVEVTETPNEGLMPVRHPQGDLFVCDIADAILKDVMQQMEHPFYSLSKKPVVKVREYRHGDHWLRITPSVTGQATIYDKDILIFAISQVMAARRRGDDPGKRVRISSREFLITTNRGTGGRDYVALVESLERLRGTTISTNIRTGDEEQIDTFGLIESSSVRRKFGLDGRLLYVDITLSDWVYNAIKNDEVLTLHPDYFRLSKPTERRLYEIARKHCGKQESWKISLRLLRKKSGSMSPLKRFRQLVIDIAKTNHLPDYVITFDDESKMVTFTNRENWWETSTYDPADQVSMRLDENGTRWVEDAKAAAPRYDVYELYDQWRTWWADMGKPKLENPRAAFVGFCRKRYKQEQQDALPF